jgi:hypothetical protein
MPKVSATHSFIGARDVGPMENFSQVEAFQQLQKIGLVFDDNDIAELMESVGMDALVTSSLGGGISTPVQFLQAWLPGLVKVVTAARKIDTLVGIQTVGSWEDEEIVQQTLEYTGKPQPYGDYTNIPLSSWNGAYERRTIVRFEEGFRVGKLEEKRAGKRNINSAAEKREAAAIALDILRNQIGFVGYNSGVNRTYGLLNDPSLPAYVDNPGPAWAGATFQQIIGDLRFVFATLRTQSGDLIDPSTTPITLAISTNAIDYMTVTSDQGISVRDWLSKNYPNARAVSAPELNSANGGANVLYAYADKVDGNSTDDGAVITQLVAAKMFLVGTEQQAKAIVEDYSNALGGIMVKRPFGVVRLSGI